MEEINDYYIDYDNTPPIYEQELYVKLNKDKIYNVVNIPQITIDTLNNNDIIKYIKDTIYSRDLYTYKLLIGKAKNNNCINKFLEISKEYILLMKNNNIFFEYINIYL